MTPIKNPFTFVGSAIRRGLILAKLLCFVALNQGSAQDKDRQDAILAAKVRAVFEAKCVQCHGEEVAKPDADFGYVRDLQRVANNSAFITKGSPSDSELFRLIRDDEMPPDDSGLEPATAEEKKLVRGWILANAPSKVPENWRELASQSKLPPSKNAAPPSPTYSSRLPDSIASMPVTLEMLDTPAAEVIAKIAEQVKLEIDYRAPAIDRCISLRLKSGTLAEALSYVALTADLILKWENSRIRLELKEADTNPKPGVTR